MDKSQLTDLLEHPTESLGLEIKRWLNPAETIDTAKIARALIALRNFDGGTLLLGFDNASSEPTTDARPSDLHEYFHPDKIQALVSKHARPPFEVEVHFVSKNDAEFPIIVVSSGVTFPVMARSNVRDETGKLILEQNAIYTRCLANNRVSSSKPVSPQDWDALLTRCFKNREVDVGRFIQRHLPRLSTIFPTLPESLQSKTDQTNETTQFTAAKASTGTVKQQIDTQSELLKFLNYGRNRFHLRLKELQAAGQLPDLPPHGLWEAACIITGHDLDYPASESFLDQLFLNQPHYTGWPMWLDSRRFEDKISQPYTYERGWESILIRLRQTFFNNHVDFWRIEPRGRFYQCRAIEDDISGGSRSQRVASLKSLDFAIVIARVTEAVGVCLQYAKGLGCPASKTLLKFAFRWSGLRGRELTSWAEPGRSLFPSREAVQDELTTFVDVPLATESAEIPHYTMKVTRELFEVFGKEFKQPIIDDIGGKILSRRY
jgi:hypothetical protein